ncbi:MAG: hypothetical protein ACTHJT_16140 [Cytophaga sp.]|uniref:hypothetical protein n=1 Tax=Cytophaga sp. TaxID=29535 RepID=UPI003F7F32CF
MKNRIQASIIFLSLASLVLVLGSCRKEKIKPEQANSFIKYYGKGGTQKAGNVALTPDGGYILVGTTDSYGNGKDILVVKTDQYGNEQWSKVLGGAGDDEGNCVIVSNNGNYILTGSKAEAGGTTTDVYVAELSASGELVGSEILYGVAGQNDIGNRIIKTLDNGFAIVGTAYFHSSVKDTSAVYLVKLDQGKVKQWESKYGNNNVVNVATSICQYYDTVYVTSAYTNTPDMLITTGRIQKDPFFYNPKSNIGKGGIDPSIVGATDVLIGNNHSRYILGTTNSGNIFIANVDNNDAKVYFKALSNLPQAKSAAFLKTFDGGFIITGSEMSTGSSDILVVRTDANANVIWSKTFGGTGNDYGSSVVQTNDGGFVVSGTIAFGGNATGANDVISLIRIDSNGELK